MHLIGAADLPPGHAGCRQCPWQGLGTIEWLRKEGVQLGGTGEGGGGGVALAV